MFTDIKNRIESEEVKAVLSLSIGYPTSEKVKNIVQSYVTKSDHHLYGMMNQTSIVGCIGFKIRHSNQATILNIAVL